VYWSTATICTVGFGDYKPRSLEGKVFCTLFVLSSCTFMARTLLNLVTIPVLMRTRKNEIKFLTQFEDGLSKEQLASIFHSKFFDLIPGIQSNADRLSKAEFTLLLLHMMNKIDLKEVMIAGHLFDRMDKEHSGVLTMDKLTQEIEAALSETQLEEHRRMSLESDISKAVGDFTQKLSLQRFSRANSVSSQQSNRELNNTVVNNGTTNANASLHRQAHSVDHEHHVGAADITASEVRNIDAGSVIEECHPFTESDTDASIDKI
jgi:hypothetical protein